MKHLSIIFIICNFWSFGCSAADMFSPAQLLFEQLHKDPSCTDKREMLERNNNFSRSLMIYADIENAALVPIKEFGEFAEFFLNIIKQSTQGKLPNAEQYIDYFEEELRDFKSSNKTSYEWFFLFCDRLTYLVDVIAGHKLRTNFNTKFDLYKYTVVNFEDPCAWLHHDRYKKSCQKLGDRFTREMASPIALASLFPHVVCLPYSGELNDWDLVKNFPSRLRNNNLWLCGFVLEPINADGVRMSPAIFFTHDYHHLAVLLWALNSVSLAVNNTHVVSKILNNNAYEKIHEFVERGKKIFDQLLNQTINIIESNSLGYDDEKMFKFFTFLWTHEFRNSLLGRFYLMFDDELVSDHINDELYYFPLLPESLKKMTNLERKNAAISFARKYQQFLGKNLGEDLQNELIDYCETYGMVSGEKIMVTRKPFFRGYVLGTKI